MTRAGILSLCFILATVALLVTMLVAWGFHPNATERSGQPGTYPARTAEIEHVGFLQGA